MKPIAIGFLSRSNIVYAALILMCAITTSCQETAKKTTPEKKMIHGGSSIDIDSATGLVKGVGFETVVANCTICHSGKLIAQQEMDRKGWVESIRWMQREHGLHTMDAKTEATIFNYLEAYYRPQPALHRRRAPLVVEWEKEP